MADEAGNPSAEPIFKCQVSPPAIQLEEVDRGEPRNDSCKCEYTCWSCQHDIQQQKRIWYLDSLKIGKRKVKDEWGFSSTGVSRSVSRSQTPTVPGAGKEAEAMKATGPRGA